MHRNRCFALAALILGCSAESGPHFSLGSDGNGGNSGNSGNDSIAGNGGTAAPAAGGALNVGGAATNATGGTIFVVPPGMGGAGDVTEPGKCGAVSQTAMNTLQPVDIIFGVDTTGSMAEEIGFTEQNMNAFSQQITSAGIDVRVILISVLKDGMVPFPHVNGVCIAAPLGSGNCPADTNAPRYVHIAQPIADWDMLQQYVDMYPKYKSNLRENSFKTFVSISDGDIQGDPIVQVPINTPDEFIAAIDKLEPGSTMWKNWRYSAIYSFSACGIGNVIGQTHADLVARTKGVAGNLCLQDFGPVFDDVAKQVVDVVTLSCDWAIPQAPGGQTFDPHKTNVQLTLDGKVEELGQAPTEADCGTKEGWHYDNAAGPRKVVACPSTCTRIQVALNAKVDVLFGCETIVIR